MKSHIISCLSLALSRTAWATGPAAAAPQSQSNIVLAGQLGPYPVSIYDHEVKTSRPDPLAPSKQLRRLMVTVYRPFLDNFTCPSEYQSHVPYMPPVVAAALLELLGLTEPSSSNASSPPPTSTILDAVQVVNCSRPIPPASSSHASGSSPLLLFSPGYGGTHHAYAGTLLAAASSGYTVVAIDPTWEAAAVVFPDGFVAYHSNVTDAYDNTPEGQNFLAAVRAADAVSVLDAIERGEIPSLGRYSNYSSAGSGHNASSSTSALRAVMYGHSFGGSTAANVALSDRRVVAAGNIDGPWYPPVGNSTLKKPLFMMSSESGSDFNAAWPSFYKKQALGWKTWVQPNGTAHYGYTDLPLLADLLGLRGTDIPESLTGTVDSRRLQEIVWRYTTQFFDYILKDAKTPRLLQGPSADFPDVAFVGHAEK